MCSLLFRHIVGGFRVAGGVRVCGDSVPNGVVLVHTIHLQLVQDATRYKSPGAILSYLAKLVSSLLKIHKVLFPQVQCVFLPRTTVKFGTHT